MPRQPKQSTYISVCLSEDEKAVLDAAVKTAGLNRNAFIRRWIASLRPGK